MLAEVRRRLAADGHVPAPVQRPVPVMVAAMGGRGLRFAAEHADVVGLAGALQVPGRPAGSFILADSALTDERVALVHDVAAAHGRRPELDVLLQQVVLDADPAETVATAAEDAAAQGMGHLTPELLRDTPFALFAATPQDAAAELRRRTERWGVRCWSTHAPWGDALARVAAATRDR